uniref:C2 DOCK-type domain-containing protein n=1 Tax=Globisporangium ultimum (strain ATCC 200006 / CBS 805.95 / DAOM BR144) TaxID=431595 RepID=K3X540_GLOUD
VTEATIPQAEEEKGERPQLRITTSDIHAVRKLVSPNGKSAGQHQGFGIERGTVELVKIPRKELIQPQSLPLPIPPPKAAPIIHEFCRPWRALRLRPYSSDPLLRKAEASQDQSLLKNYEPRFSAGEPTFPTEVSLPTFLEPRVSVEDAHVFLVSIHLRFTLGMVEPLFCRLVVYDISLGCRVTEEFSYSIPGAMDTNVNIIKRRVPISSAMVPHALFYALPNHLPQHLYLILKVSKILMGDGESATSPYCFPEKLTSETEQQKLIEKAADCFRRLGQYRQPLAWGAIALMEGSSRPMTLYRQRTTMSDDQRLPLIAEAVRGTLKEKVVPSVCEFDLERIDDQRLTESKFQSTSKSRSTGKNTLTSLPPVPVLDILDPFSSASVSSSQSHENEESSPEHVPSQADSMLVQCREVQPFCHPSMASAFGLTGCGPVAVSYMNVMYLYPIHLERFQYRNIAIRVQLLQKEVDFLCGLKDFEVQGAVLQAIYAPNQEIVSSGYTLVNYHQKNPQFENEIKICLPEKLTLAHHILFTFYHVHCKKIQPNQQQQEIVGYAILPVLQNDGTIVQDNNYVMNVFATPIASKASTTGGVISLSPGYVAAAREAGIDTAKTSLTCRTRVLSSIHSQDRAVSAFLQPFHSDAFGSETKDQGVLDDDQIVNRLLGLRQASNTNVCYFFFPIARFVLGYLRFGSCVVRWAAFRAFLAVLEKASWTPHRSLKQDANQILHNFVHVVFDEYAIENPCGPVAAVTSESSHPQSIFHAMLMEWLIALQDSSTVEDNVETKRSSLAYSNMLLQLILKSMAMHTLHQYGLKNGGAVGLLPMTLSDDDDELTEAVLCELVYCIGNNSNGLLLQKEVNRSIAYFCRGLFLVAKNQAPAHTISQYMVWVSANQRDPNVLVHVLFPFIRILIDFEYFAVVNGACTAKNQRRSTLFCVAEPSSQRRGWLAKIVFEKLLYVADEQKEEKIRCDAVRLLRRMFVAQVYNQFHQSQEHQEQIALIYFSFFPSIAQFTTDGKLLYSSVSSAGVMSNGGDAPDKSQELKKELLICVAHLLSSVSTPYLSRFFQQFNGDMKLHAHESGGHEFNPSVSLSPTGALMHYRKIVEEVS